jgi:Lecithin retinol acyltransferase
MPSTIPDRRVRDFAMQLVPGAHVKVRRSVAGFTYFHHGIVSECDESHEMIKIVHFASPERTRLPKEIVETSLAWFLDGGKDPSIEDTEPDYPLEDVVKRARSQLGKSGYFLPTKNCEHFASWCRTRSAFSGQVFRFGESIVVSSVVALIIGSFVMAGARNPW